MALADFIYRLKPQSGDSTPHDEKAVSSDLSGGTIALVDAGSGDYCWQFTGVASASGFSAAVDTDSNLTGVTLAVRLAVPTYDTVDGFAYLLQVLTTGTAYGPVLGQSSANFIRPRVVDTGNVTATAVNIGTAIRTVVMRYKPAIGLDVLDVWWDGLGTGDTPDHTASGNLNTRTFSRLLVGSANSVIRLFDCVVWGEALSDANCAALADTGIRATLDVAAPSDASGNVTADSGSVSGGASSYASEASGNVTADSGSVGGSAGPQPGTITSEPLYDNAGNLKASVSLNYAAVYHPTTGALVVRKTGLSTNGAGVYSFSDAAIVQGIDYRHDWETADGTRCMPQKAAA